MLAKGTDKVLGESFSLVDVSAYLAFVALCLGLLGLGLDVCVIVAVRHGLNI